MALGYEGGLFILAFDHRGSFKKMFGIKGREATEDEDETLKDGKVVVWEGFKKALDRGAPKDSAGVLVDEEMGTQVAREAAGLGVNFAMPVEASGEPVFQFEYGDEFGAHIEDFDPMFSKVLVRYNPEADSEGDKQTQIERLKRLADWLHERGRRFLFELLVPASEEQLERAGGQDAYDRDVRPDLMLGAIDELQRGGVEPDIWKIEGIDRQEDCERIAEAIRREGRDGVVAVVLGRGADAPPVDHWLQQGAPVDGYVGFAIGRTIWRDPLQGLVDGELDRDAATSQIADNYLRFIEVYEKAAG
ncbi:MAG: 2-deoxy-5-keto-D-gluconate 6-phosphate aldolase domain-containing protein [Nitriliruptorales bacterium]